MANDAPDRYTINNRKDVRKGRIFIDYLRNDETASAVAAYAVRARPGAPVSVPIDWTELPSLKSGAALGIKDALKRRADPRKDMARAAGQRLPLGAKGAFGGSLTELSAEPRLPRCITAQPRELPSALS
jgi:bifunctional non-homologous end joining protein LigD